MRSPVRHIDRRGVRLWDELENLQAEVDRLLDAAFAAVGSSSSLLGEHVVPVDLLEESDRFVLRVDVPGMRRDDIQVTLHDGCVTVAGEVRLDERYAQAQVHRSERVLGRFQRTVALPAPVAADQITARYREGVLEVILPKAEEARPRHIQVQAD
ncbi:MAG: Hsp20/alpha crystallin family protein [Verrucomicrobiota bacterium]|nr:Hsp20/alpha crystallin family protein [Limisphaera sp.]MDW8380514.1 Hsp20/alpha crystallin family protein [Verrucomicrobiota bacterium]